MSVSDKAVLILSDDPATAERVTEAVRPLVKHLVLAQNSAEAMQKAATQPFDCIILRLAQPSIPDPAQFFTWCQAKKSFQKVPWIVLGKDIENEEIVVKNDHVKFLEKPDDGAGLIRILNGVFFNAGHDASKPPSIDVNFINPIVKAVSEVIKSMAQIELKRGAPFLKKTGDAATALGDISGIIAMNSDKFLGSMAFCFEKKVVLKIYENMLGTKSETINDDVKDAVSEMTNIIFGNAKRDLNAAGHTIAAALPSVITGPKHEIRHSVSGHCFCIPFTCDEGRIVVECVISPK